MNTQENQITDSSETHFPNDNPFNTNARPQFLSVLCILTFIASGLGILSGFGLYLGYESVIALLENGPMAGQFDLSKNDILIGAVYSIITLVGAVLMYQLKKSGFYIYATVNILAMFYPDFSVFTIFFNALWIGLYGANFKSLK